MTVGDDLTALSYWFPKLLAAGLPVPRTTIIKMPEVAQRDIWRLFDNEKGATAAAAQPFFEELAAAARDMGFPCFLRSDHTSDKHEWKETCFLSGEDQIKEHVLNIAYFSECCGMIGIPWNTWAVREMLPTMPLGVCPGYGDMPICREFRFFVRDGSMVCVHPYWPREALADGGADPGLDYEALCDLPIEAELCGLAEASGRVLGGDWSIDILETRRGWVITDLAEAHKSFHWEGCGHAASFKRLRRPFDLDVQEMPACAQGGA